ncbi:DHA2 family efflux MFS transporter permease subunit [Sphingobium aromaticiconvertens]|uniref:DHA2 family efflux MFS transporter permease subunit n=1 Tax=Sphingobium aromaticiconvertens TaxID=365341 RepID=UPI003015C071
MSDVASPAPLDDVPVLVVRHKLLLTLSVMGAMLMQVLDQTIANVALPHMQASLGATQDSVSWVLTSYIVSSAIALPATGWLANQFGARRLFIGCTLLFVLASALCGMAANLPQMILFRVLQGVGGAFIGPLVQAVMLDMNRPSQHARAMSFYGMGVVIGPIMGPVLGGWLTDNFDWRWVFYVNIPLGILSLTGMWMLLPNKPTQRTRFDVVGWALIGLSIAALQLMLDRGQHVDWFASTEIWVEAGIALAAFWMFLIHLATSRSPIFSLAMLRDRNLASGMLFMFIISIVMMSAMALLPSMLQNLFGYSVMDTGELMASRGVGVFLTMACATRLLGRVDARLMVAAGMMMTSLSLWMMTGWSLEMDWRPPVFSGFLQGVGMGLAFVPINLLAFSTLPPHLRTDAAGVFNLARNIGASVGIAVVTALLARNIQVSHADLAATLTPYNLPMDPTQLQALGQPGSSVMAMLDGIVNKQAAMIAYLDDFKLMMILCLLSLPLLIFIKKPARGAAPIVMAE